MNATHHLALGLAALVIGLLLALVGQHLIAPEHVHPIGTGLIAVGVVATLVSLVERLGDRADHQTARAPRTSRFD